MSRRTTTTRPRPKADRSPPAVRADRLLDAQRVVVAALVVGTAALFWRGTRDTFNLVRATSVVLGALIVVLAGAWRAATTGRVTLPRAPAVPLAGAFVGIMAVATAVAGGGVARLVGPYGRYTGLVMYAAYAILFLAVLAVHDRRGVRQLAWAGVAGLGVVTLYGLLQVADLDPFDWRGAELSTLFSTLGQTNFAAGYVAITLPLALWALVAHTGPSRGALSLLVIGAVVFVVETRSFQGLVAGGAGVAVFAVGVGLSRPGWRDRLGARRRRVAWGATAIAAMAAVALMSSWSFVDGELEAGVDEREHLWAAALGMAAEGPVIGHGPGAYAELFPEHRSAEHAVEHGLATADAPHNVPLDLLVSGGALLLIAYLAIVAYTGWALVRGLRTLRGPEVLLLGGLGGAWAAYQVQSLVSIDVPALAVLHWLLAGAVLVVAGRATATERRVPALTARVARAGRRRGAAPGVTGAGRLLQAAAVTAAVVIGWIVAVPLRADLAADAAAGAARDGDAIRAERELDRAAGLAPWEGVYRADAAALLQALGRPDDALAAAEAAAAKSPGQIQFAVSTARLAEQLGRHDVAERWLSLLVERAPGDPRVLYEAARYQADRGRHRAALELFRRAVEADPTSVESWLGAAVAHEALAERPEAREAYRRVLELDPDNERARGGISER